MMVVQSLQAGHSHGDGASALTAGIGLLPCPLTISVLGFAWTQSSFWMVLVVLISLALDISLTISLLALIAILGRRTLGLAFAGYLPRLERWSRIIQGGSGPHSGYWDSDTHCAEKVKLYLPASGLRLLIAIAYRHVVRFN